MMVQVNFKSGLPVYLQLVEQVKAQAASGALRPGESLPAIRQLAELLRVNRNTVAKAYSELEAQGIIETIAGKGCFVKANHSPYRKEVRLRMVSEAIDAALVQAHHSQVGEREFLGLVKERLELFQEQQKSHGAAPKEHNESGFSGD